MSQGLLVVISGPSGVGKSTIAHAVEERLDGMFSVSMTTRPQTPKDRPGVDYVFVDRATFDRTVADGQLLEWAEVFGNCYGTPRGPVEQHIADGKLVILEIDVEGALQVRENYPQAMMIFIMPPTMDTLLQRLRDRGRDDEATIQQRFAEHAREIERAQTCGAYDVFLVNDELNCAITEAIAIIQDRMS